MIIDLPSSSVAPAVERIANRHKKIMIASTGFAANLDVAKCIYLANSFNWDMDDANHAVTKQFAALG